MRTEAQIVERLAKYFPRIEVNRNPDRIEFHKTDKGEKGTFYVTRLDWFMAIPDEEFEQTMDAVVAKKRRQLGLEPWSDG